MSLWTHTLLLLILLLLGVHNQEENYFANALGCNWGRVASHPLPPDIVVRLLKDNNFDKVKLFEADPDALIALGRSGIQVMLGIPNEFLAPLASSVRFAEQWVAQNVSSFISKYGVDIRSVAVGNEPFLKAYKGKFQDTTFPALQNIQAAIIKAGLSRQVKVTVPFNAAVYQTDSGLPSGGNFRSDIHALVLSIVSFLRDNAAFLTINIYPFLSLYADANFPLDYAFFDTPSSSPIVDGPITYTNVFEANYDTLVFALEKNGFSKMEVVVGEIGWPTDGDRNAKVNYARRFNQGLIDRIVRKTGTPRRPGSAPDIYLFGLLDEDMKSIDPGNFERHWGVFNYDGTVKYPLVLDNGRQITAAKGVRYLDRQWCVFSPSTNLGSTNLEGNVNYACTYADCTSLGFGSSCNGLDPRSNVSYAFNQYFQTANQQKGACGFNNMGVITRDDPSQQGCRFEIMIDVGKHELPRNRNGGTSIVVGRWWGVGFGALLMVWFVG